MMAYSYLGFLLLALGCWAAPSPTRVDYTGHQAITVVPENQDHVKALAFLRKEYELDFWNEPSKAGNHVMIRVSPDEATMVLKKLEELGMTPVVAIKNLQKAIDAERIANAPTPGKKISATNFQFNKYHRLDEIYAYLSSVGQEYSTVRISSIGQSYEGRAIHSAEIGSGNKPIIIFECGVHAREWASPATCLYIIDQLTTNANAHKDLLQKYNFYIVPASNPDGYKYSWEVNRYWRKTRSATWIAGCYGADANRNFDISHCGVGTSRNPCEDTYCGPYPNSESETEALTEYMKLAEGNLKAYISLHAFSQLWMTPYGYTKSLPADYSKLEKSAKAGVDALKAVHKTVYKYGSIANIIYEASGSSIDYAYDVVGAEYAYALELRDTGTYGFMLPADQIIPTAEETWAGLKAAIKTFS